MLPLAADENFNNNILRGLLLRKPDVDIIRIQDVGLSGEDDPIILEWTAKNHRILITHDVESIPELASERIKSGLVMPGVFIVNQEIPISRVIDDLLLLIECSDKDEWINQIFYLPL
jgi:hypothetical protein